MNSLVVIDGKKAYTTSRIIARGVGVEHEATIRLIRRYEPRLNKVGLSDLKSESFKTAGRAGVEYHLDERQAAFLLTLMKNSEVVVDFKMELTNEFFRQRDVISALIARQRDPGWMNVRKDGKQVYFQKTDVIKQFVDYATAQGSKNAGRYYANLAKMENNALFFFEQKYPNVREVLTIKQLMQVATADDVVEKALKDGMKQNLPYKECYVLAKERIIAFAGIIGKSPVLRLSPALNNQQEEHK